MTDPRAAIRAALPGAHAWFVGGAVRDDLLGRKTDDVDVVVAGDPAEAAAALARATASPRFPLSEAWGAWRVTDRAGRWQVDLTPLAGSAIEEDLARRDFSVNAMARAVAGGKLIDPHDGRADMAARRLRMVSERALSDDPLRTLRAARIALELAFEVEPNTVSAVRRHAGGLARVAPERVWAELKRILVHPDPVRGVRELEVLGLLAHVLPELDALHGVEQSSYHHLDVFEHTLAVLGEVVALEAEPFPALGEVGAPVDRHLAAPLADGLTGWQGLRVAALLHDAAKPTTRARFPDGRVGFPGHDSAGAGLARAVLTRLKTSERLRAHVAALVREHLRLGFLVHRRPLPPRAVHAYLVATRPVTVDVTVLTVADRMATRGRNAQPAIAAHVELSQELLAAALAEPPSAPLVRGDELAAELGLTPGPELGTLLAELEAAQFAGEVSTRDDALAHARRWRDEREG